MAAEERELDLAAALGAEREASTQVLSVYVPNKNRHGRPINTRPWIREAQEILTRIGEGYTTTPPHDGGWESEGGTVRREKTVILTPTSSRSGSSRICQRCVSSSTASIGRRTKKSSWPS